MKPWTLIAGALGASFVAMQTYVVPIAGVELFTVASLAGQTAISLLVDRLRLTGGAKNAKTKRRVMAAVITVVAVLVSSWDRFAMSNFSPLNRNNNMEAINRNNVIAVELNYPEYWRTAKPSTTFHGRDIFASVGAHLASGVPLEKLGTIIDHKTLVRLSLPPCQVHDLKIQGCIQYIDGFGNLVTNIPGEIVANKYWYVAISKEKNNKRKKSRKNKHKKSKKNLNSQQQILSGSSYLIGAGQTYGDVPLGHFVALVGSHGWVEIALNGGNAQQKLKVDWGTRVQTLFT
jgi:S-adenosylmethionine hydrolase